jgi:hypothetical protein
MSTCSATVEQVFFGEGKESGAPYIKVTCLCREKTGMGQADMLDTYLSFKDEKTTQRAVASLRVMGWDGDIEKVEDESLDKGDLRSEFEVVVETKPDNRGNIRRVIKWVNVVGGGGNPVSAQGKQRMMSALRAAVSAAGDIAPF